jgi:hypothetical protein
MSTFTPSPRTTAQIYTVGRWFFIEKKITFIRVGNAWKYIDMHMSGRKKRGLLLETCQLKQA